MRNSTIIYLVKMEYVQAVSLQLTRFSNNTVFKITRFILVLSFVNLVLNHSSAYMDFCLHGCFQKSQSRGPLVIDTW